MRYGAVFPTLEIGNDPIAVRDTRRLRRRSATHG
jgi:hypothetical protein